MQIKTADGTSNVASQGLGVWGAVGGGLGTLALLNQGVLGGGGLFGGCNRNAAATECHDTRIIAEKDAIIANLNSKIYTDEVATAIYTKSFQDNKEVIAMVNDKFNIAFTAIAKLDKDTAVAEAVNAERLGCLNGRVNALEGLAKLVIPRSSCCPPYKVDCSGFDCNCNQSA